MERPIPIERVVVELDLSRPPDGPAFRPMEPVPDAERALFDTWETPLSPWGGFNVPSGLSVSTEVQYRYLAFERGERMERALVARNVDLRDGHIVAQIRCGGESASPHNDRDDANTALAGVVFRWRTARQYYEFGIERTGGRAVLYRRRDDDWFVLAEQRIDDWYVRKEQAIADLSASFVKFDVQLDGDAIRCSCPDLGVDLVATDAAYRHGKVGLRALNGMDVALFRVAQTDGAMRRDGRRHGREAADEAARGRDVPDAVLVRTYRIADLGGSPTFEEFAAPGRTDLLVEGISRLRALTSDGEVMWETVEPVRRCVFSKRFVGAGRLIYGFAGKRESREAGDVSGAKRELVIDDEMVVLDGATGEILAREELPANVPSQRFFDWSPTSARFGSTDATDIVLREWRDDHGGGGVRLWAFDRELKPLWEHVQTGAHYGHHWALGLHDVDGDGRDELLAGGYLYGADGTVLWVHDGADEMERIHGAGHYDAVLVGDLAGNRDDDPTAFLVSGSAGVYVVDALTGETRSHHRVGHAQGRLFGKVRPDLPGTEVLVATRWGNYGILTLFSGRGERLWSIQPDSVGQGATPIVWGSAGHRLIWTNTTRDAQAFYDGYGRRVRRLPGLSEVWGDRMGRDVGRGGSPIRLGRESAQYLTLTVAGVVHVFGPDE